MLSLRFDSNSEDSMTPIIRPATPADASATAPLIYSAAPQKYDYWFGAYGHDPLAAIENAFINAAGVMGYQHYWVASDARTDTYANNGNTAEDNPSQTQAKPKSEARAQAKSDILGGGAFYAAKDVAHAKRQLIDWAARYFGVAKLPTLVRRGLKLAQLQQPFAKDMLYVGNLGVYPEAQGKGIATALLNHHEHTAKSRGLILGLDVAVTNTRAKGLYEHLGFTEAWQKAFCDASANIPSSCRMYKVCQSTPGRT